MLTAAATSGVPPEFTALAPEVYDGDARWIPEEAATVNAFFSPANPLLERMRGRTWCIPGKARLAAFVADDLVVDDTPAGFFGFWESAGDAAADAQVFGDAARWVASAGAEWLFGPVDGSTFGRYRLVLGGGGSWLPFPGEPYNPPEYPQRLEALGFEAFRHYHTRYATFDDVGPLADLMRDPAQRARDAGYSVLPITTDLWMERLPEMHAAADSTFGHAFAYTPLTYAEFEAACGESFVAKLCPHASMIGIDADGALAGFQLTYADFGPIAVADAGADRVPQSRLEHTTAFPRLLDKLGKELPAAIPKTTGVLPGHRKAGVMALVGLEVWAAIRERYGSMVYAITAVDNPVQILTENLSAGQRNYALYRRDIREVSP